MRRLITFLLLQVLSISNGETKLRASAEMNHIHSLEARHDTLNKAEKISIDHEDVELNAEIFQKEEERILGGYKFEDDAYGMFSFDDTQDWTDFAITPDACITTDEGDFVVFTMYGAGNNSCKKKSLGTYKTDLGYFIKAYGKDLYQTSAASGGQYKVDQDAMTYLFCTQYYYNNNMFYLKVGCREATQSGFQMHTYSDEYCTQKLSNQFSANIDLSTVRVSFGQCRNCVGGGFGGGYNSGQTSSSYSNNNYNYNYNNNKYYFRHSAPLCSGAWQYKSTCNRKCRKGKSTVSKGQSSSRSSSSGGGGWFAARAGDSYSGDEYSLAEHFFLWAASLNALFFFMGSLAMRKRLTKQEMLIEETAIKAAGVEKKWIPRIFLLIVALLTILVLARRRVFMWFCFAATNIASMSYFVYHKSKQDARSDSSDFQIMSSGSMT